MTLKDFFDIRIFNHIQILQEAGYNHSHLYGKSYRNRDFELPEALREDILKIIKKHISIFEEKK